MDKHSPDATGKPKFKIFLSPAFYDRGISKENGQLFPFRSDTDSVLLAVSIRPFKGFWYENDNWSGQPGDIGSDSGIVASQATDLMAHLGHSFSGDARNWRWSCLLGCWNQQLLGGLNTPATTWVVLFLLFGSALSGSLSCLLSTLLEDWQWYRFFIFLRWHQQQMRG